jgi:ABC-type sugar transport system ATPase subunit
MPRRPWGAIHWSEAHRRVAAVLEDLDITVDPHTAVGQLSVAHQRMVMIARGVIAQARLLVLDEPTASLTNTEIESLFVVLNRMRARGVCIVYVSHRLAEITALTDSVVVMRDGRVIAEVATSELDRRRLIELIAGRSAAEETARLRPPVVSTGPVLLSVEALADGGLVRDVSIEVRAGEVLGLAGLVGSGRTELANLVFGAGKPTGGAIRVAGKQVSFRGPYDAVAHGIALLPEDRRGQGNIESYSVRENISLPSLPSFRRGRVAVPSVREERAAASRLADELSIKVPSIGARVGTLSGGNQQKVVLAKWLHHGADVFIFDEPTHGIDVDGKEDVYRRMRELADEGKGVVFISSEFEELAANCDRAIVLREGTVAGELAGEKITEEALLDLCYARDDVA